MTYEDLKAHRFAGGSMLPKVLAACWFAQVTGRQAGIGALADVQAIVAGRAGTRVGPAPEPVTELFGIPMPR